MSLIFTNKKTLFNSALIVFSSKEGNKEIEKENDFTIIKVKGDIVGINIQNLKKYFTLDKKVSTLNKQQVTILNNNGIEIPQNWKSNFSVGKITKKETHPKSNKLWVLKVETKHKLQIVTNIQNININDYIVVANIGATLPLGTLIIKSKIMGILSEGMICSGKTLNKEKTNGALIINNMNQGEEFIL